MRVNGTDVVIRLRSSSYDVLSATPPSNTETPLPRAILAPSARDSNEDCINHFQVDQLTLFLADNSSNLYPKNTIVDWKSREWF